MFRALSWLRGGRAVTKAKPVYLGRWETRKPADVQMRVGQLTDHDGCGAKECVKPDHTTGVDADIEWFARTLFASTADAPQEERGDGLDKRKDNGL